MSKINTRAQYFGKLRPNGRRPSNYPADGCGIPLRITKNRDLDREPSDQTFKKSKEVACNDELMKVLDCFGKHEYDQTICAPQITAMEQCFTSHIANVAKQREGATPKFKSSKFK